MKKNIFLSIILSIAVLCNGCDTNVPIPGTLDVAVESITLDSQIADGIDMAVGTMLALENLISVSPADATDRAQYYFSSNPDIASVSPQGVLSANNIGSCNITVSVGLSGLSSSFNVNVLEFLPIDITSIEFITELLELTNELDTDRNLHEYINVNPADYNEQIIWTSSNEAVVKVESNGTLLVLGVGEAVVTATAKNHTSISDQLAVKVNPKPLIDITTLEFTTDSKEFMLGETSEFNLRSILIIEPGNQTEGITFESSNTDVVSVNSDGLMTIVGLGDAIITVKAKKGLFTDQLAVKVKPFSGDYSRILWTMTCSQNPLPNVSGRNNSLTAMLDDDPNSCFCITRPGKNSGGVNLTTLTADEIANYEINFIIDTKKQTKINYFKIDHLSNKSSDRGTRLQKISEVLGSNDGIEYTSIKTSCDFTSHAQVLNNVNTGAVSIPESEYRYYKFVMRGTECYDPGAEGTDGSSNTGNTCQIKEFYLGLN